jgi:hypothetical protein
VKGGQDFPPSRTRRSRRCFADGILRALAGSTELVTLAELAGEGFAYGGQYVLSPT